MKPHTKSNFLIFASRRGLFPIRLGGSETAAHDLLSGLHAKGYDAEAFGVVRLGEVPKLNATLTELKCDLEYESSLQELVSYLGRPFQVPVENIFRYELNYKITLTTDEIFPEFIDKQLEKHRVLYALVQGDRPELLSDIARRYGICPIFYSHSAWDLSWFSNPSSLPLILANSKYLQEKLRKEYSVNCEILYPAVNVDRYFVKSNSHEYITMINPIVVKGIVPFIKVALARPDRKFLAVDSLGAASDILEFMKRIPNMTYLGRQVDMRTVYSQTHILMVPSQLEEAFGRVIPEAQISGIPVLASQVGGIPEAIGYGGVLVQDIQNPKAWLQGLETLEAGYDEFSVRARENAKRFSAENAVARFLDILHSINL